MRKLILSAAAVLAMAGATTAKANSSNQLASATTNIVQDSTTKSTVKLEELPEPVKATLKADVYKAWTPVAAHLVKTAQGAAYYQIDVKKGEETAYLKIDKDGKVIE